MEKAIKHGIAKRTQGGAIQVAATSSNGALSLCVSNDGPSLPADWETGCTGIGIANLRTRLRIMYGGAFEFHLHNRPAGGVQAAVLLPLVEREVMHAIQ